MKRILVLACAAFALTGCTTMGSFFAEAEQAPSPIVQANAYVPIARPVPADFCLHVSLNAGNDARVSGFDAATQERLTQRTMQQCQTFTALPLYASL